MKEALAVKSLLEMVVKSPEMEVMNGTNEGDMNDVECAWLSILGMDDGDGDNDGGYDNEDEEVSSQQIVAAIQNGEMDADALLSAAQVRPRSITPEKLSQLWQIDISTAKKTLDITSQHSTRKDDSKISRNYVTKIIPAMF